MTKVCVTGGSGFIGSYVVEECLKRGYHVVATVRDVNKCKHLENMPGGTLTLVHADLTIEGALDGVLEDCVGLFHTAAPVPMHGESSLEQTTWPAVQGTELVLKAAAACISLKRVVFTSSIAAMLAGYGKYAKEHTFTEEDWSNVDGARENEDWYVLGKTLSEQLVKEQEDLHFDIVSILPSLTHGKIKRSTVNASLSILHQYLIGKTSKVLNRSRMLCDVRDVALAHVLAFENPKANGRYMIVTRNMHDAEMCDILRKMCPDAPVPSSDAFEVPDVDTKFCTKRAKALGIAFTTLEESLYETVLGMYEHGIVPYKPLKPC